MTGRANGVATYRNTDFFGLVEGLNFALQYQGKMKTPAAAKAPTTAIAAYVTPTATVSVFNFL
jgi:predicted porin